MHYKLQKHTKFKQSFRHPFINLEAWCSRHQQQAAFAFSVSVSLTSKRFAWQASGFKPLLKGKSEKTGSRGKSLVGDNSVEVLFEWGGSSFEPVLCPQCHSQIIGGWSHSRLMIHCEHQLICFKIMSSLCSCRLVHIHKLFSKTLIWPLRQI